MTARDPFTALGLRPSPGLTDEDIRSAWRRIAAATHPDRPDGGDPDAYREASAAYMVLRTGWGRSEAYADLRVGLPVRDLPPPRVAPDRARLSPWRAVVLVPSRIRHGRPGRLLLRILAAAAPGPGRAAFRRGNAAYRRPDHWHWYVAGSDEPRGPRAASWPVTVPGTGRRTGAWRVVLYPPAARRDPAGPALGHFAAGKEPARSPAKASRPRPPPRRRTPAKQPPATPIQPATRSHAQECTRKHQPIAPGAQFTRPYLAAKPQATTLESGKERHDIRTRKRS